MMAFLILFGKDLTMVITTILFLIKLKIRNKKHKVVLLPGKSKSENFHQTMLLGCSARTSTILVSKTKIYVPTRSYPGGAGKNPKIPSNTNVPPTNVTPINLSASQAKDAVLLPNNNNNNYQPYNDNSSQNATGAEKTPSTPKPSFTPNQSKSNDPFKETMLDQQKKQAEQKAQSQEKQIEHTHSIKISEETVKKMQEIEKENNEKWKSQHPNGIKDSLFPQKSSTSNEPTYSIPTLPTKPSLPSKPLVSNQPSLKLNEDENIVPNAVKSVLPILEVVETEHSSINPTPLTPNLTHIEDLNYGITKESLETTQNKKNEIKLFLDLRERGLIDKEEDALTMKGHELLQKIPENKQTFKFNVEDITSKESHQFNIGILDILHKEETFALLGIHTHMSIIYETMKESNEKIIFGFLTSTKTTGTICLSETQPFAVSDEKDKKQMFSILTQPLAVRSDDIKSLPNVDTKTDGYIDQQSIGENYIAQPLVNKILQDNFTNKIIPIIKQNNGNLPLYDGAGLTYEKAEKLVEAHDKEIEQKVKETLAEYKNRKNQGGLIKATKYLKKVKQAENLYTYNKIEEAINAHERQYK